MVLATVGAQVAAAHIDPDVLASVLALEEWAWRLGGTRSRSCLAVEREAVAAAAVARRAFAPVERVPAALEIPGVACDGKYVAPGE